jgi:isopenicillin N synthase-like dioxygenase
LGGGVGNLRTMGSVTNEVILDVDLLAYEKGDATARRAVVDGVMRSLGTGFVYTKHDVPASMLDEAYAMLVEFFSAPAEEKRRYVAPGTHGQTGYTGLLVETAAGSDVPDWKEMLNWGVELPAGHPLRRRFPHVYPDQVLPEGTVPGIAAVLTEFHRRIHDTQRRFLRIIAAGLGCAETLFDDMLGSGATLTRAIHYPAMELAPGTDHIWAGAHADINLITALPRASARGLQVLLEGGEWVDAVAPEGQMIINSGMMLEHLSNGVIRPGIHRVIAGAEQKGDRYSVVQFCHPTPWTVLQPLPSCITPERPQAYGAIQAGDKLDQVLYDINLVEDARRVS